MINLTSLNPPQRDAVTTFTGPIMILAGAGTGKTRVITMRIAHMISRGIPAGSIAAMTFTNKAAREMKERIEGLVGREVAQKLTISTFHSFCLQILRTYPKEAGLERGFSLLATADQVDLVRRALADKGWSGLYRAEQIQAQISLCKNWLLSPGDLLRRAGSAPLEMDPVVVGHVYEGYEQHLKLNRAIDFDDCIFKVHQLFQANEALRSRVSARYPYLMVDEYQDTNAGQFAVLKALAIDHKNICVVGDDDQSVYSWRGAMVETLEVFEKTFAGTKLIRLEQNYRCSNQILHAANTVIRNNKQRKDKTLWSESKVEHPVNLKATEDAESEARWISERSLAFVGEGYRPSDIAILYRANNQAKLIEMALRECGLAYKTFGGQSFFERKEVKDFLSYLRLITNLDDHMSLWRIINVPTRGIGLKTQEVIEHKARETKQSPFQTMRELLGAQALSGLSTVSRVGLKSFVETIDELSRWPLNSPDQLEALGKKVIESFGLEDHLRSESKNLHAKRNKAENLRSLPGWLKTCAEDLIKDKGFFEAQILIDKLTCSDVPTNDKEKANGEHISLMTIHASKGLEFPVVFVSGLEEGGLPHRNSLEQGEASIAEERRLFYVAITRAKERLALTYAHARRTGFSKEDRKKSRFLKELPLEGVFHYDHAPAPTKEERKEKTISRLAQLRQSLT